ncbi:hypothetical protein [Synechococcus sp. PCC 6312]|nr:hypothetical protein [Synechococcus sp. PCC 6312]
MSATSGMFVPGISLFNQAMRMPPLTRYARSPGTHPPHTERLNRA